MQAIAARRLAPVAVLSLVVACGDGGGSAGADSADTVDDDARQTDAAADAGPDDAAVGDTVPDDTVQADAVPDDTVQADTVPDDTVQADTADDAPNDAADTDAGDVSDADDPGDVADDGDAGAPAVCSLGMPPFEGRVCAGGCALEVNELIVDAAAGSTLFPGLALDDNCAPYATVSTVVASDPSYLARRTDDGWEAFETPARMFSSSLVFRDDGTASVLGWAREGVVGYTMTPSATPAWAPMPTFPFAAKVTPESLTRSASDAAEGVVIAEEDGAVHAVELGVSDGGEPEWQSGPIGIDAAENATVARRADGPLQVVAWHPGLEGGWELSWWALGAEVERVTRGGIVLGDIERAVELNIGPASEGNPFGVPYVVIPGHGLPSGCGNAFELATRGADGTWTTTPISTGTPGPCVFCGDPSTEDTCASSNYLEHLLGSVATPAGVTVFFVRRTTVAEGSSRCDDTFCRWDFDVYEVVSDVYVVRPGEEPTHVVELDGELGRAELRVDPLGRVHAALYARPPEEQTRARYLRFAPLD